MNPYSFKTFWFPTYKFSLFYPHYTSEVPKTDDAGPGGDVPMGVGDAEGEQMENQEVADAPCKALGVGKMAT